MRHLHAETTQLFALLCGQKLCIKAEQVQHLGPGSNNSLTPLLHSYRSGLVPASFTYIFSLP